MDERYRRLDPLSQMLRPHRGWIRAVRDALGMSGAELGHRLGISQQRVAALEQAEIQLSIQLDTLARAADALNCHLVYALVPRTSLTEAVKAQARSKATQILLRAAHHSRLENQAGSDSLDARIEDLAETFVDRRGLWNDSDE
ncbi:MAG: mobile mystery protein A [Acidimicrobiia bacterium]|nr:mobile mystery protein A [Acidimicrobiia bacterium]MXY75132.1 mobile mystery protein A [Acidimicrobiia bacterium]MYB78206.1 mobile mystery protein A [Acidimicrobiia bacterium]MYG92295.1 mobile mystery protein A [Acidimicrobiia bacterium]